MNQPTTARDLIALPGAFRFKVILQRENSDQDALVMLTRTTLAREVGEIKISINDSKGGKYRGYTVEVLIHTYEEIEALYLAYRAHPASVWVM